MSTQDQTSLSCLEQFTAATAADLTAPMTDEDLSDKWNDLLKLSQQAVGDVFRSNLQTQRNLAGDQNIEPLLEANMVYWNSRRNRVQVVTGANLKAMTFI